ncbi:ras-related protein Rab-39B-like [Haliotis rubra]|uniref:ras-related protein Rab-39B-like n=1 Tax=Haliotis rubra TaxID=36100 RepID=UPI001EE52888|nr:ras-related protein Rab-39B-like [Haliotis rubra]
MVEPIFQYQFRLILIGDSTVGKSSILRYFTDGKFEEQCDPTVGVDFYARLIEVKPGIRVKLQLWDTAGQERFRSITRSYYRNSVGVMIIYDITKRSTFENIKDWYEESKMHIEPQKAVYLVLGHKSDMEEQRQVTAREGRRFAEIHGHKFLETSAKSGKNIEESFALLARDIYQQLEDGHIKLEDGWDGVKPGFSRPKDNLHLLEGDPEGGGCC